MASKVFNPKEGAEKFTFQAEVNRLMDIIIHSLYSNKVCCSSHCNHAINACKGTSLPTPSSADDQEDNPHGKMLQGWRLVSRKIYMLMLAAAGDLPAGAHLQRGGCPGQNQVPFPHGQEAADRHIRPGDPHQGGEFHFVTVAALDSLQGCPHLHPSQPRAASQCPLHALQRACSNSRIWCRVLQLDYENTVHSTILAASSSPCIAVSTTCASEDTQQDRRTEGYMWCRWIMRTGC